MQSRKLLISTALAGFLFVPIARADLSVDLNGATVGGVTPRDYEWQNYDFSFAASSAVTTLSFWFRNDPGFAGLDTVSVSLAGTSVNLLTNGGFETGPDIYGGPPHGWYFLTGPNFVGSAGALASDGPQAGSKYWADGAVGGHDGIAQAIQTAAGQTYDLSFWLESSPVPNGQTVDYQVFAGAATNAPVSSAPEPASICLLLSSCVGLIIGRAGNARRGPK